MEKSELSIIFGAGLVLTAAIWGFAFVVVKDSLAFVGPTWMVAIRFTIAAVCFGLIFIKRFQHLNKDIFFHGCFLGVLLFLGYLTQTIGCNFTTAGKNAFLTTFYVILVPLIGWPVFKKKPLWYVWVAAAVALTGIGLLALDGDGAWYIMNRGDVLTLICGIFFALHIIAGSFFVKKEDVILLTFFQFAASGVLGFLTAPFLDGNFDVSLIKNSTVVVSMLYLGIFSSMVCFVLQNVGLKYVPSALASLFLSLESVFGVLCSCIFLGERLTLKMFVGCALIFCAIVLAEVIPNLKQDKK